MKRKEKFYLKSPRFKISMIVILLFSLEWIFLAFNVYSRADWLLQNLLVFLLIGPVIYFYTIGYVSLASFVYIFLFLAFHSVGAHYTYSLVPYNEWSEKIFGLSINSLFGWKRNNFDRFVHFLWGLILFKPLYELFSATTKLKKTVLILFTAMVIISSSTIYELIEWLAALNFGGDLGLAYVGAQGDQWDAQKDQALAFLGIFLAIIFFRNPKNKLSNIN